MNEIMDLTIEASEIKLRVIKAERDLITATNVKKADIVKINNDKRAVALIEKKIKQILKRGK